MVKSVRFLFGFCGILLSAQWAPGGLVCAESVHDYGTVSSTSRPSHTFVLENSGTQPVRILKIRKTCGCVATTSLKRNIESGETAEVKMSVSLRNRSGAQFKSIYVTTDSPETPRIRLVLKGKVAVDRSRVPAPVRPGSPHPGR